VVRRALEAALLGDREQLLSMGTPEAADLLLEGAEEGVADDVVCSGLNHQRGLSTPVEGTLRMCDVGIEGSFHHLILHLAWGDGFGTWRILHVDRFLDV
jgi:hypothetical protein